MLSNWGYECIIRSNNMLYVSHGGKRRVCQYTPWTRTAAQWNLLYDINVVVRGKKIYKRNALKDLLYYGKYMVCMQQVGAALAICCLKANLANHVLVVCCVCFYFLIFFFFLFISIRNCCTKTYNSANTRGEYVFFFSSHWQTLQRTTIRALSSFVAILDSFT